MSLNRNDFGSFFAELHDGEQPYAWQWRVLDAILQEGRWPDALVAPTGAGKTAAIDVHVFALAMAVDDTGPVPPRRLAMIVGRRVLVDDQYEHACAVAEKLAAPGNSAVLAEVANRLWRLQDGEPLTDTGTAASRSPLLVARLRGGVPPSRRWIDHPTAAAVVCATPEMWGSRLLFRGYGSSWRAWAREAGLLAIDTVAVVDEAHLARQLLHTARRVAELAGVADMPWKGPSPLQVVATTATPPDSGSGLGVEPADLDVNPTLRARVTIPKPITFVEHKDWAAKKPRASVAEELARQTVTLLDASGSGTVGCFVNTIPRAVAVLDALRDKRITGRELTGVMVCGRVRPIDLELLETRYPGLFSSRGNPEVDVLLSTQSLEVGVDLDLAGMVTELADGSALAQRAGRVNRRGLRETGPITVMIPAGALRADARSGPYTEPELTAAWEWLQRRAGTEHGLAPWTLRDDPAPAAAPRRTLWQRPELGQAWHWARTSDALAAEPELDLWLSDDLDPDFTVGVAVRRDLPADTAEAIELVRLLRPRAHEIFAVPLSAARTSLASARRSAPGGELGAVLVRGDDVASLEWTPTDDPRPRIRPGDVVVVDETAAMFTAPGDGDHQSSQVVIDDLGEGTEQLRRYPAEDVLETPSSLNRPLRPGEVVHRIELGKERELADLLTIEGEKTEIDEREVVRAWLAEHVGMSDDAMALAAAELLSTESRKVDVVVQRDVENVPLRVAVIDGRRAVTDEYVRQEWTPCKGLVGLSDHQRAVAERAAEIAERLRVPDGLIEVLRHAGLHHDDGKADTRFQIRLGARAGAAPLAKSADAPTPETVRRRLDRSGLPPGWRHEQRSVVEAWPAVPSEVDRELVARLIGTTHGHGRSGFPHTADGLLNADENGATRTIAAELFDEGGWDELIEDTERHYGVWVCAYLEALLRAADGQISAEGR